MNRVVLGGEMRFLTPLDDAMRLNAKNERTETFFCARFHA